MWCVSVWSSVAEPLQRELHTVGGGWIGVEVVEVGGAQTAHVAPSLKPLGFCNRSATLTTILEISSSSSSSSTSASQTIICKNKKSRRNEQGGEKYRESLGFLRIHGLKKNKKIHTQNAAISWANRKKTHAAGIKLLSWSIPLLSDESEKESLEVNALSII